tara:strand:- start:1561 stop:1914 length:354 start_codon:yes stop_codon:yes gene_type:complete
VSKSNIFNIIAILVIFGLLFYIFKGEEIDTSEYDAKINALEKKVDSLHQKNTFLEKEADSLEFAIEESDKKIKQLNTRIYVIKKETIQQLNAVDLFGDDELEQFFAKRYGQYSDSIN